MKQEIKGIISWLKQQVNDAQGKGLVVGVSGGLDSAVVAYLIKQAFPKQSLGVIMPVKSNSEDIQHAKDIVEDSQIKHMTVDLTETHDVLYGTIQDQLNELGTLNEQMDKLADANLRARLRMSTLYTIAANEAYLVTGTDNQSEWYTGYFTKYGDGGVDLQPIINYTKTEVQEIARCLGVPSHVIDKQPSADLWQGQTDENEMGTTYNYIDAYLDGKNIPNNDQQLIEKMHNRTEHKRHLPPQYKR